MHIFPITLKHPSVNLALNLYADGVAAGFPSPADDYIEASLDLNEHLIKHPSATYFARANGDSLNGLGIYNKDLLIVDRALKPHQGDLVIAAINGQLCCKILDIKHARLLSANPEYPPIPLPEDQDLVIEGVVIHAVHHLRR